jgi:CheY-like chemotaxis protein
MMKGMAQPSGQVMILDRGLDAIDRVALLLRQSDLEVHRVRDVTRAVELAWSHALDLVVAEHPLPNISTEDLIATVRDGAAPSRNCGLVLVCTPESLDDARVRIGHGVSRAVSQTADLGELMCAVVDLLHTSPRTSIQAMVELAGEDGDTGVRALTRTVNLSLSGMLVTGARDMPVGSCLTFELLLAGDNTPIAGSGRVVRHTVPNKERVAGIGVAFDSLAGDGQDRLATYLLRQR